MTNPDTTSNGMPRDDLVQQRDLDDPRYLNRSGRGVEDNGPGSGRKAGGK